MSLNVCKVLKKYRILKKEINSVKPISKLLYFKRFTVC